MNVMEACLIVENVTDGYTEEDYREAWQYLLDTGICWQLQGWYGRSAQQLLDSGYITKSGEKNS